eukprot:g41913.t1
MFPAGEKQRSSSSSSSSFSSSFSSFASSSSSCSSFSSSSSSTDLLQSLPIEPLYHVLFLLSPIVQVELLYHVFSLLSPIEHFTLLPRLARVYRHVQALPEDAWPIVLHPQLKLGQTTLQGAIVPDKVIGWLGRRFSSLLCDSFDTAAALSHKHTHELMVSGVSLLAPERWLRRLSSLRALTLDGVVGDSDISLYSLQGLRLEALTVWSHNRTVRLSEALGRVLVGMPLQSLHLSVSQLPGRDLNSLLPRGVPSLQSLVVHADEGLLGGESLSCLLNTTNLRRLEIPGCDGKLQHLAGLKSLQKLNLAGSNIKDQDLQQLQHLPVEILDLTDCETITNLDMSYLHRSLRLLSLSLNFPGIHREAFAPRLTCPRCSCSMSFPRLSGKSQQIQRDFSSYMFALAVDMWCLHCSLRLLSLSFFPEITANAVRFCFLLPCYMSIYCGCIHVVSV